MWAFLETQRQPARCLTDNEMQRPLPLRPTNPEAICPQESWLWLRCRETQVAGWSCHWPQHTGKARDWPQVQDSSLGLGLEDFQELRVWLFLVPSPPAPPAGPANCVAEV